MLCDEVQRIGLDWSGMLEVFMRASSQVVETLHDTRVTDGPALQAVTVLHAALANKLSNGLSCNQHTYSSKFCLSALESKPQFWSYSDIT